jgi:chromosome segregation ATPase
MSFGPPPKKDSSRRNLDEKKGSIYGIDAPYSIQQKSRITVTGEVDVNTRLEMLESNLARVTNQQDSLLPLMNMLEIAPNVAKNDNLVKNLHKKSQETEDKITKMEQALKNFQFALDQNVTRLQNQAKPQQFDAVLFERNLKNLGQQINEQKSALSSFDNRLSNHKTLLETKLQAENENNTTLLDQKFDKYSSDFNHAIGELKNNINDALKKFDEGLGVLYTKVFFILLF